MSSSRTCTRHLRDRPYRPHVLPLQHLVHQVDVVHALLAVTVPLMHRVHPQESRPTFRLRFPALADPGRCGLRLLEYRPAPPVRRRLAQVVEVAVRDVRQTLEALVAVLLQHPPHHRPRTVPAHLPQRLVDLGQKTDVGLRVPALERLLRRTATVHDPACLPVLTDQALNLRQRLTRHLRQVAADHALVRSIKRTVAVADQRLAHETATTTPGPAEPCPRPRCPTGRPVPHPASPNGASLASRSSSDDPRHLRLTIISRWIDDPRSRSLLVGQVVGQPLQLDSVGPHTLVSGRADRLPRREAAPQRDRERGACLQGDARTRERGVPRGGGTAATQASARCTAPRGQEGREGESGRRDDESVVGPSAVGQLPTKLLTSWSRNVLLTLKGLKVPK